MPASVWSRRPPPAEEVSPLQPPPPDPSDAASTTYVAPSSILRYSQRDSHASSLLYARQPRSDHHNGHNVHNGRDSRPRAQERERSDMYCTTPVPEPRYRPLQPFRSLRSRIADSMQERQSRRERERAQRGITEPFPWREEKRRRRRLGIPRMSAATGDQDADATAGNTATATTTTAATTPTTTTPTTTTPTPTTPTTPFRVLRPLRIRRPSQPPSNDPSSPPSNPPAPRPPPSVQFDELPQIRVEHPSPNPADAELEAADDVPGCLGGKLCSGCGFPALIILVLLSPLGILARACACVPTFAYSRLRPAVGSGLRPVSRVFRPRRNRRRGTEEHAAPVAESPPPPSVLVSTCPTYDSYGPTVGMRTAPRRWTM